MARNSTGAPGRPQRRGRRPPDPSRDREGDGSIIVGYVTLESDFMEPFIWDAEHGMRSLTEVLIREHGLAEVAGWHLAGAYGISADGRTIVGYGVNPNWLTEAWVAHIPEPAGLALLLVAGFAATCSRRRTSRN